MARGKNSVRRRTSLDENVGGVRLLRRASIEDGPMEVTSTTTQQQQKPTAERYVQEIHDVIEFHWKNLSLDLKNFILGNLHDLNLQKLVGYWRTRSETSSNQIAASSCGCSWYLALQYFSIGKYAEARALTLNGCFLQQCYNTPFEQIAAISHEPNGDLICEKLPFFSGGIFATASEGSMSSFLKRMVTPDYQRRMSFATQTDFRKEKVQNYVDQISNDWDTGRGSKSRKREVMRRRASMESSANDGSFVEIEIKLADAKSGAESVVKCDRFMTLKMILKRYAEDRNIPLRRLRFSYNGGTLFLSSVANKTPQELNMSNLDMIYAADNEEQMEEGGGNSSSDDSKDSRAKHRDTPSKSATRRKQCRRASWAGPEKLINLEELLKQQHSLRLSRVFAEASPRFELIRQQLNAMNLACSLPKDKTCKKKVPLGAIEQSSFSNLGLGGKAGVPFYSVHVGEAENLYKVTRPLDRTGVTIDLHGLTRDEALAELDAKLPEWINVAMRGAYPWVIPAVIVCGGGNQILSEAVDQWIKANVNVAKAPKLKFSRRGSM